jgi:hypothetical protein
MVTMLAGVGKYLAGDRLLVDRPQAPSIVGSNSSRSNEGTFTNKGAPEGTFTDFERYKVPGRTGRGIVVMELSQFTQLVMGTQTSFGAKTRSMMTEIAFRAVTKDPHREGE